jgi:hypothetical protein
MMGEPVIRITLTDSGKARFAAITRERIGKRLAIVVDGMLLNAPVVRAPITGGSLDIAADNAGDTADLYYAFRLLRREIGISPELAATIELQDFAALNYTLDKAIRRFDRALTEQDTAVLSRLLHKTFTFIHSNGWKQTKADVLADAASGKLVYEAIRIEGEPSMAIGNQNVTIIRRTLNVSGLVSNEKFSMKIRVVENWRPEAGSWKLLSRQSIKLP